MQHFVYSRVWHGFAPDFPNGKFNALPDDRLHAALHQSALERLGVTSDTGAERAVARLEESADRKRQAAARKRLKKLAIGKPTGGLGGAALMAESPKQRTQPCIAIRAFNALGIASIHGQLEVGGWSPSTQVYLPPVFEDQQTAEAVAGALQEDHSSVPYGRGRFPVWCGVVREDELAQPEVLVARRMIDAAERGE